MIRNIEYVFMKLLKGMMLVTGFLMFICLFWICICFLFLPKNLGLLNENKNPCGFKTYLIKFPEVRRWSVQTAKDNSWIELYVPGDKQPIRIDFRCD